MRQTMIETMIETANEAMSETTMETASEYSEGTSFRKDRATRAGINWGTAIAMGLFHVGAIAALFFFTWPAFFVAIFLWWVSGSLGIGMSYPRLLTHRGYKTPKWVEYFLTWCATLALEGGPIFWVATHRIHHQFSDDEGDPHSPIDGKWWSHMGAILFAIGGWPWLLWGVFARVVVGLHSTWMVNSVTHLWGSRRFATKDLSTNNGLVALLTFGEGWHNNHHAHPVSARHGLTWYEIDMNWYGIWTLQKLGLARHVYKVALDNLPPKPALLRDVKAAGAMVTAAGNDR